MTRPNPISAAVKPLSDDPEFLERCEATAMRYFRDATKEARQARTQTVVDLQPYYGSPKYRRLYEAAAQKYETAVVPAHELYLRTLAELELTGEVGEALSYEWDQLKVAQVMAVSGQDAIDWHRDHARGMKEGV